MCLHFYKQRKNILGQEFGTGSKAPLGMPNPTLEYRASDSFSFDSSFLSEFTLGGSRNWIKALGPLYLCTTPRQNPQSLSICGAHQPMRCLFYSQPLHLFQMKIHTYTCIRTYILNINLGLLISHIGSNQP